MSETKKDEPKVEKASGSPAKMPGVGLIERGASGSWKVIKGLGRYFSQLVRGTLHGTWTATGGAVLGPLPDTAHQIVDTSKEIYSEGKKAAEDMEKARYLAKVGPAISGTIGVTASALSGVLKWPLKLVGGAATRITRGGQEILDSVFMQYDKSKGGGVSGGTEAPAAA